MTSEPVYPECAPESKNPDPHAVSDPEVAAFYGRSDIRRYTGDRLGPYMTEVGADNVIVGRTVDDPRVDPTVECVLPMGVPIGSTRGGPKQG